MTSELSNELSIAEAGRLGELVRVVEEGMATFMQVGRALSEINGERLYRETHKTFQGFCTERFGFTASRARQLIGAAAVVDNLVENGPAMQPLPVNALQAEALAKCPHDVAVAAWTHAVQTADVNGEGEPIITAKHVKGAVDSVMDNGSPPPEPERPKDRLGRFVEPGLERAYRENNSLAQAVKKIQSAKIFALAVSGVQGGEWMETPEVVRLFELLNSALRFAFYHTTCPDCRGDVGKECETCNGYGYINRATFNRLTDEQKSWLESSK